MLERNENLETCRKMEENGYWLSHCYASKSSIKSKITKAFENACTYFLVFLNEELNRRAVDTNKAELLAKDVRLDIKMRYDENKMRLSNQ